MSLVAGVHINAIVDHLAVLYCLTINPERGADVHLEQYFREGRKAAEEILRTDTLPRSYEDRERVGWRESFGDRNHDPDCFQRADLARVEDKIIAHAKVVQAKEAKEVWVEAGGGRYLKEAQWN